MIELSITEYAQKKGLPRTTVKSRLYHRDVKPTRIVGTTALYREEDLDTTIEPLPKGRASPKWGKNRQFQEITI